ncbi:hypothetical protein C8R44DRAFT_903908 [Mycena epipterygia]|nr:hypothetical protein C8R44DRAFT_903908 [Mycena epipterygia]
MSDQPAVVAREARSIHAGLKTLLSRDVWANYREADFQRKNLRRRYLHLLLLHPGAREARDAGTHLWMQTSYAFIALYKQRLSRPAHNNHANGGGPGTVETRKLLQRFRQFLADEERFWRALVLRVQRAYDVALPASAALPAELIGVGEDDAQPEDRMNHFGFPAAAATPSESADPGAGAGVDGPQARSVLSKALVCLGDIARYREQYKVPPGKGHGHPLAKANMHDKKKFYEPRPNYARPRALYLAAHALAPHEGNAAHQLAILAGYEGDTLASVVWYLRALCVRAAFDTAGENLAGVLTRVRGVAAERSKNDKEGKNEKGEKNEKDAVHDKDRDAEEAETEDEDARTPARVRVERFKRDLVLLQALWREGSAPPQQTLALAAHTARVFARLVAARALPEDLIVRVGVLAQGAVWVGRMLAPAPEEKEGGDKGKEKEKGKEREKEGGDKVKSKSEKETDKERRDVRAAQLAHLLALHTALLGVGVRELGEVDLYAAGGSVGVGAGVGVGANTGVNVVGAGAGGGGGGGKGRRGRGAKPGLGPGLRNQTTATTGGTNATTSVGAAHAKPELAERISAEFRRTLPALRVGSKWVLGNWTWVQGEGKEGDMNGEGKGAEDAELEAQLARFWATYAEFLRRLARTFPVALLPALSASAGAAAVESEGDADAQGEKVGEVELELELEEDLDMRGWLPLRGLMGGPDDGEGHGKGREDRRTVGLKEEVHPNVEQLMRIADLLRDGRRVVGLEGSPLALYGGQFVVKGVEAAKPVAAVGVGVVPPAPNPRIAVSRALPANLAADKLALIRDSRVAMPDLDDDAMTEKTSRTDDDILHDAFSFLNQEGSEDAADASDEDEIVWDLRDAPVSPVVPTARTSPKTPVRPPPIGPPSKGPPAVTAPPLSPFRTPQPITPGTQIPSTTALDLLNTFSMPKAPKPIATGVGGESLLFGARAGAAPAQSIWSASRDEQGLMFAAGGGGGVGSGMGQHGQHPHHQQQQYQGLAHHEHQRYASQDMGSQSQPTIWASSPYPSASQHHVPTAGFVPQAQAHHHHQRVVSNSMAAAQLFPSGGDQYGYGPLSVPSPQYTGAGGMDMGMGGGMAHEQLGVFYATAPISPAGQGFSPQSQAQAQHAHARHLSLGMHDPRHAFHGQPVTPMSQLWGNVG